MATQTNATQAKLLRWGLTPSIKTSNLHIMAAPDTGPTSERFSYHTTIISLKMIGKGFFTESE